MYDCITAYFTRHQSLILLWLVPTLAHLLNTPTHPFRPVDAKEWKTLSRSKMSMDRDIYMICKARSCSRVSWLNIKSLRRIRSLVKLIFFITLLGHTDSWSRSAILTPKPIARGIKRTKNLYVFVPDLEKDETSVNSFKPPNFCNPR